MYDIFYDQEKGERAENGLIVVKMSHFLIELEEALPLGPLLLRFACFVLHDIKWVLFSPFAHVVTQYIECPLRRMLVIFIGYGN